MTRWQEVMQDLQDRGYGVYRVSQILGVNDWTARNWTKGGEPRHANGEALLEMHRKVCAETQPIGVIEVADKVASQS